MNHQPDKTSNVYLSFYPNTRGFGYACTEGPSEVIDCGVATVRPVGNEKLIERAKRFIEYYEPTLILVQNGESKYSRQGERVLSLIREITAFAAQQRIVIKQYTREQIRFAFEQFGAKTKYEVAQKIISWLPEMKYREPKARKIYTSEDYNMGVFDALSLVFTHIYMAK